MWFKVNGPGTAYEPRAHAACSPSIVPDLAPELLAVDLERGWTLMRDAGPTLRDAWAPRTSCGTGGRASSSSGTPTAQLTLADARGRRCWPTGDATTCGPVAAARPRWRDLMTTSGATP